MQTYPRHVAIIPDGCRRWAAEKKKEPWVGHVRGIEVLEKIARWGIRNTPVEYYTLYGLSIENLDRPKDQLEALEKLYAAQFLKLADDEDVHANEVHVDMVGREDLLPTGITDALQVARDKTQHYTKKHFRIALAYSGKQEIVDAVEKMTAAGVKPSVEAIAANLYSDAPDVDLLIRTSEQRVSNFMLWQAVYAELYVAPKLWPDFTVEDYQVALEEYAERKRRFGK